MTLEVYSHTLDALNDKIDNQAEQEGCAETSKALSGLG